MPSAKRLPLVATLLLFLCGTAFGDWDRGMAAFNSGDYATAEAEFRAEVAARPEWAGAHYMLGETLRRRSQWEDAVTSLRRAVELDGDNLTYRLGLGQGLVSARDFSAAVEVLGHIDPTTLNAEQRQARAILLASAELSRDRAAAAVAALQPELASGADDPQFQRMLGHSLLGVGRNEEALAAFARAFELNPGDTRSAREAAELALDLAAKADNQDTRDRLSVQAVRLSEALAAADESSESFELAARCLLNAHEAGRALPWVDRALAVRPDDPELLYLAGWSLRCLGRTEDAVRRLREALDRKPDAAMKARIHAQLARVAVGRFDIEEAVKQHRLAGETDRARELEETFAGMRSSLKRLGDLRRQINEVNAKTTQLEKLGQADAAAQVRARVAVLEEEASSIEANLGEVRQALKASTGCE